MLLSLKSTFRLAALCVGTAFAAGCSQDSVGPATPMHTISAAASSSGSNAILSTGTQSASGVLASGGTPLVSATAVRVLSFRTLVMTSVTASAVIGAEGGVLSLVETGLTVQVPPGAVSKPTTFRVTPIGNGVVAYDFEPHGTTFAVPLKFSQDLSKTNFVAGMALRGGYFSSATDVNGIQKTATVKELLALTLSNGRGSFVLAHFSGYLVSCA